MILTRPGDWPLVCEAADEFAGDEWVWESSSLANLRLLGGDLSEEDYATRDAAFMACYGEALRGHIPPDDPTLRALATELGLLHRITHDRRPPKVAPCVVPHRLCCDVAEDFSHDLSSIGPDRFLGPWADGWAGVEARSAATALAALLPVLDAGCSAIHRWDQEHPRPPLAWRASLAAVQRAPAMLWRVEPTRWAPVLPLAPLLTPEGLPQGTPARLGPPGGEPLVLARVYPTADGGWAAFGAVGVGAAPPTERLVARLELELLRLRRHERRSTWEDLLRLRPEVLYRSCAAFWWRRAEEVLACD